jgi:2-dehydropantoate 2-reductase
METKLARRLRAASFERRELWMNTVSAKGLRIAVMGSGGVGGYFGGRLAAAGFDVSFIARGAHLAAMRADGLRIESPIGDTTIKPVNVTDDPATIGEVDVVMFTTKLYDVRAAGELCRPLIGPDTVVLSFLNGIDSEESLIDVLGAEHVAGGVARISSSIVRPGVIGHHASFAVLEFGELDGRESDRLQRFLAACQQADIKARIDPDITAAIWRKYIFLASFAAITALTRCPFGAIRKSPATYELLTRAVAEVAAVGVAKGVDLGSDPVADAMQVIAGVGDDIKASMLVDLERGKPIEVEYLSGAVQRLGREFGIDTPVHDFCLAALMPFAQGRPEGVLA